MRIVRSCGIDPSCQLSDINNVAILAIVATHILTGIESIDRGIFISVFFSEL